MNHTDPTADRAAKAEALLLRFTAEAHRRKWDYDRGLDGDGVPLKSEAFDALHRLGDEMRAALDELRQTPAAASAVVSPPTDRADLRGAVAGAVRECLPTMPELASHVTNAVLTVLPEATGRAAVLGAAADALPDADLPFVSPMGRRQTADWLRRLAVEAHGTGTQQQAARCSCGGTFPINHLHADTHEPAPVAQQPAAETRCTCADAGDCFAPAGHYADCPAAEQQAAAADGEETHRG